MEKPKTWLAGIHQDLAYTFYLSRGLKRSISCCQPDDSLGALKHEECFDHSGHFILWISVITSKS